MKNTGRRYEEIVEATFKKLMSMDTMDTLRLERNAIIVGKSGTKHEIDVYWEYKLGSDPNSKKVLFQAKDWSGNVNKGEILKFKAVIDDIAGHPAGVFVTKHGYQRGAKEVAKHHGIPIWILREPRDEDWEGRIRTIHLTYHIAIPSIKQNFILDEAWNKSQINESGLDHYELNMKRRTDQLCFYDKGFHQTDTNLHMLQNKYLAYCYDNDVTEYQVTHEFGSDTFMSTGDSKIPYLKITGIDFIINITEEIREDIIDGMDIVQLRLFECLSGTHFTIHEDDTLYEHVND
jgi:hypothetical protein